MPNPDKNLIIPMLDELIAKNGIYNHENLDFLGLIADGNYEFAYIFIFWPAPIKGASGSNGGPIAVTWSSGNGSAGKRHSSGARSL